MTSSPNRVAACPTTVSKSSMQKITPTEIKAIFNKVYGGAELTKERNPEIQVCYVGNLRRNGLGKKGWTQQFHYGAIRNNNTKMFKLLGPDTGFDSIGEFTTAKAMSKFLDRLNVNGKLTKTILYNLNPCANEVIATMLGSFQDDSIAGKDSVRFRMVVPSTRRMVWKTNERVVSTWTFEPFRWYA